MLYWFLPASGEVQICGGLDIIGDTKYDWCRLFTQYSGPWYIAALHISVDCLLQL